MTPPPQGRESPAPGTHRMEDPLKSLDTSFMSPKASWCYEVCKLPCGAGLGSGEAQTQCHKPCSWNQKGTALGLSAPMAGQEQAQRRSCPAPWTAINPVLLKDTERSGTWSPPANSSCTLLGGRRGKYTVLGPSVSANPAPGRPSLELHIWKARGLCGPWVHKSLRLHSWAVRMNDSSPRPWLDLLSPLIG